MGKKNSQKSDAKKVGLALSGGAVLGFAHLGVIRVLEENGIPIHCVAGTSAGALVGVFVAAGYSFAEMWDMARHLSWGKLGGLTISRKGLFNSAVVQRFIEATLGKRSFADLQLPFATTSVDLMTGECLVMREGSVAEAVRASCIIPGVYSPLEKDGRVLIDGGFRNFLPVDVARQLGADYVIAVKLVPQRAPMRLHNVFQILIASLSLGMRNIALNAPGGDVTIVPDLRDLNSYDFDQARELVRRGEDAARAVLSQIQSTLAPAPARPGLWTRIKSSLLR
jgi:NTE family protein